MDVEKSLLVCYHVLMIYISSTLCPVRQSTNKRTCIPFAHVNFTYSKRVQNVSVQDMQRFIRKMASNYFPVKNCGKSGGLIYICLCYKCNVNFVMLWVEIIDLWQRSAWKLVRKEKFWFLRVNVWFYSSKLEVGKLAAVWLCEKSDIEEHGIIGRKKRW